MNDELSRTTDKIAWTDWLRMFQDIQWPFASSIDFRQVVVDFPHDALGNL